MTVPASRIGDKGQRYEINSEGVYGRVGWASTIEGARVMRDAILLAPACKRAWIIDRDDNGKEVE